MLSEVRFLVDFAQDCISEFWHLDTVSAKKNSLGMGREEGRGRKKVREGRKERRRR